MCRLWILTQNKCTTKKKGYERTILNIIYYLNDTKKLSIALLEVLMTFIWEKYSIFKDTSQVCRGKRTQCLRFVWKQFRRKEGKRKEG